MSGQQEGLIVTLQTAASTNGNGQSSWCGGFDGILNVEIVETNGGTATVTLEGSYGDAGSGTNWYAIGYQRIDAQATPTRAVTGISVAANSAKVYQILDPYPTVRARISSVASSPLVTVRLYKVTA